MLGITSGRLGAVTGSLALVVALGGTGYAAAALAHNSVGSPQLKANAVHTSDLKNGAVNSAKIKNGTITAADLAPGTIPTPHIPAVRWAVVGADHVILAQSGGISVTSSYTGGTYLNFGRSVAGSAISATGAYTDADSGFKGAIEATICGGAPYGGHCAAGDDTSHVWVYTENTANTAGEDHAFYVMAIG